MKITKALDGVTRLGIDTAPLIYFVEHNPHYLTKVRQIFQMSDEGYFQCVTSVVTLVEVLHKPLQRTDNAIIATYRSMMLNTAGFSLVDIDALIAEQAAHLRARYNLRTPDALQIAAALESNCEVFLTNDLGLKRVTELKVLCLDELES